MSIEKLKKALELREEKWREDINVLELSLDKKLFDKDLIFSASYFVIDENCHIFIDLNKDKWLIKFIFDLKFDKNDYKKYINKFIDYLINYYYYRERNKENIEIKKKLIELSFYGDEKNPFFIGDDNDNG